MNEQEQREFRRAFARRILEARRAGQTLTAIAREHGISRERVRQLEVRGREFELMEKSGDPKYELTVRVRNALLNAGVKDLTPEAVAVFFQSKTTSELRRLPNVGRVSILQLQEWLVKHGQEMLMSEDY